MKRCNFSTQFWYWCVGVVGWRGVWLIFWHLPEQQHETLHEASEVVMPCDWGLRVEGYVTKHLWQWQIRTQMFNQSTCSCSAANLVSKRSNKFPSEIILSYIYVYVHKKMAIISENIWECVHIIESVSSFWDFRETVCLFVDKSFAKKTETEARFLFAKIYICCI